MKLKSAYEPFERAIDPGYLRPRLESVGQIVRADERITEFNVSRVFPAANGGFGVQYVIRIAGNGADRHVVLCGFLPCPGGGEPEWAVSNTKVLSIEGELFVPLFPWDPGLAILEQLVTGGNGLAEQFGPIDGLSFPNQESLRGEVLAYRLARRCVLRYEGMDAVGAPRSVVVKVARRKRVQASVTALQRIREAGFSSQSEDGITVPDTLMMEEGKRFLVMEHVNGKSIHDLIGMEDYESACAGAAHVLSKLQRLVPTEGLDERSAEGEIAGIRQWLEIVAPLYPDLERAAGDLADKLARTAPVRPDLACVHGDFYDKQILFDRERTTLIDCDGIAAGDPAIDVGNFLGHLVLRRLQHPEHAESIIRATGVFRGLLLERSSRVGWWTSVTLVRLAILYSMRPRWRTLTQALLEHARVCLSSSEERVS